MVSGWGHVREGGPSSHDLRMLWVPVMKREDCLRFYGNAVKPGMYCAGYTEGGKDSCQVKNMNFIFKDFALVPTFDQSRATWLVRLGKSQV